MYRVSPYTYLIEALVGSSKRSFHARYLSDHTLNSKCRIRDHQPAKWYDMLGVYECMDRSRRRLSQQSGHYHGLQILFAQDYRRVRSSCEFIHISYSTLPSQYTLQSYSGILFIYFFQ